MKHTLINNRTIKILIVTGVFLFLFVAAGNVLAQPIDYVPLAPLPGIGGNPVVGPPQALDLPRYLTAVFRLLIGISAVLAVLMITIGGFQYMSTDAISGKSEGKEKINQALVGLFLAMGAWLFLYTLNPKLVEFNFDVPVPPPINTPTSAGGVFHKDRYCYPPGTDYRRTEPSARIESFPFEGGDTGQSLRAARADCENAPPPPRYNMRAPNNCGAGTNLEAVRCNYVPN